MASIYKALIITPKNKKTLDFFNPGYMAVSSKGIIEEVSNKDLRKKYKNYKFKDYSDSLICPGFIDTHNHLPQYAFVGIGDKDLLPWLKKYTFPREKTLSDNKIAKQAAKIFFKDLIKNGTTTTTTYVTIHKSATDIAFQEANKSKIRAVIGKVLMDQNSPRYLTEKTNTSIQESVELIDKWHGYNDKLHYVLTPRFAITCSFDQMEQAAKIAREKKVYIQTHLSENLGEIEFIKSLFPKNKNYTDVYHKAGLLGPKTIMAHCIYLNTEEINIIKKSKTKIAHCPTSNRFLSSGIMPFRNYQTDNLTMGLGTDVAGGYSLSMINEMKEAIENSKQPSIFYQDNPEPISLPEAFYLATLGGAKVLSMEKQIGSLEANKKADFLIIDHLQLDTHGKNSTYLEPKQILSKLIYRGSDRCIKHIYINGEKIK